MFSCLAQAGGSSHTQVSSSGWVHNKLVSSRTGGLNCPGVESCCSLRECSPKYTSLVFDTINQPCDSKFLPHARS